MHVTTNQFLDGEAQDPDCCPVDERARTVGVDTPDPFVRGIEQRLPLLLRPFVHNAVGHDVLACLPCGRTGDDSRTLGREMLV